MRGRPAILLNRLYLMLLENAPDSSSGKTDLVVPQQIRPDVLLPVGMLLTQFKYQLFLLLGHL